MPVTAKLTRLLERVGEEAANELVDWFNQVDASYRGDLRELNELNFARFDANVEQRMAGLEARLEQRLSGLEARTEQRFAVLEARLEARIDTKLDAAVAQHAFAQLDKKIDVGLAQVRTELESVKAMLEKELKDQTRWLILALGIFLVPLVGLWLKG